MSERKRRTSAWASEHAMCSEFRRRAEVAGWQVHPETGGCDLLMVATIEHVGRAGQRIQPGDVMAVEAKLQASMHLLVQAMPPGQGLASSPPKDAADFYAVLVPGHVVTGDFAAVASRLGIHVIRCPDPIVDDEPPRFAQYREGAWDAVFHNIYAGLASAPRFDRGARARVWYPDAVVNTPAGVPSPRTTSRRKVDMVRFAMARAPGDTFDSRAMRDAGVNPQVAEAMGWTRYVRKDGRRHVYELVECDNPNRPEHRWPRIAEAMAAAGGVR